MYVLAWMDVPYYTGNFLEKWQGLRIKGIKGGIKGVREEFVLFFFQCFKDLTCNIPSHLGACFPAVHKSPEALLLHPLVAFPVKLANIMWWSALQCTVE